MQGVCIQGQTTYYKEVSNSWFGWPNVVWSTWNDEPQENINYIKSKGIHVIQSIPPLIPGDLNINYQVLSTFIGLDYLHKIGCTEVLKIRGDHIINDIKSLLEILWDRQMAFMAISIPEKRNDLIYELGGYIHYGHDYPGDNIIYGKIHNMMEMFDFQSDKNYGVPPESLIVYNYMIRKNIPFELSYNHFIRNNISFFLRECIYKNIKIQWLKHNWEMISFYNNEYFKF